MAGIYRDDGKRGVSYCFHHVYGVQYVQIDKALDATNGNHSATYAMQPPITVVIHSRS
jgi:hypothetical protein